MAQQQEVDMAQLYEDLMTFDHFLELVEPTSDTKSPRWSTTYPPTDGLSPAVPLSSFDAERPPEGTSVNHAADEVKASVSPETITDVKQRVFTVIKSTVGQIFILLVFTFFGAAVLYFTESYQEMINHNRLDEVRRSVIGNIINVTKSGTPSGVNETSAVWKAVEEQLMMYVDEKESLRPYSKSPGWTFWGALFYCGTIYTTVGYGNVYPLTIEGRVITILYALIGIPLCLVVLMNLGKTFTHAIKYLWSFIRRFYYTGSFRRVRFMIPAVRLRMTVLQRFKHSIRRTTRRFTRGTDGGGAFRRRNQPQPPGDDLVVKPTDTEAEADIEFVPYEVDTTFNLPPVVAMLIAFVYMLLGSLLYTAWETHWTYFDAFYFVFISCSTIGLGDVVPEHPKFFLATALYLFIGLAVVAMVINVFMEVMNVSITKATDRVLAAKGANQRPRIVIDEETVQKIVRHLRLASTPPGVLPLQPNADAADESGSIVSPVPPASNGGTPVDVDRREHE